MKRVVFFIYGALLRLLPSDFRARYAAEMRAMFEDEWHESNAARHAMLVTRAAMDLVWTAITLRAVAPRPFAGVTTDARIAVRGLRRRPGFFATASVTIGLGIGAATAVFSVVDASVLRAVRVPHAARVMSLWGTFKRFGTQEFGLSAAEFTDLRTDVRSFARVGAWSNGSVVLEPHDDRPARTARAASTIGDIYAITGARVIAGRLPDARDDFVGAAPVAVISNEFWLTEFGGDPAVAGKRHLTVGRSSVEIIGVLAPGTSLPGESDELWIHRVLDPSMWAADRSGHGLNALALLRSGATERAARSELESLERTWALRYPGQHSFGSDGHDVMVAALPDRMLGTARRVAVLLSVASALLLLIAAVNVANLLLARGEARLVEFGVRRALGASAGRLMRPVMLEGLIIAIAGSALGIVVGTVGLSTLMRVAPTDLAAQSQVTMDARAIAFAIVVAMASGLLFSAAPAWIATAREVSRSLTVAGRGRTSANRGLRTFVAAQTALAALLLGAAGLFARSLSELNAVKPGLDADARVVLDVSLPASRYGDAGRALDYYSALGHRITSLPGIDRAAFVKSLPLRDGRRNENVARDGSRDASSLVGVSVQFASAGALRTLGIPLAHGREFGDDDRDNAPRVGLINESAARVLWPGELAVGKRFRALFAPPDFGLITVVGVYADVRSGGLTSSPIPEVTLPISQTGWMAPMLRAMTLVAHVTTPDVDVVPALQSTVHELDPSVAIESPTTMSRVVRASAARERFLATLLVVFAGAALVIAAVGVFAVVSFTVERQTRELAIRRALGSNDRDIVRRVLRTNVGVAVAGAAAGVAISLLVAPSVSQFLYNVAPRDVATFVSVPIVLTIVATLACLGPTIKAIRAPLAGMLNDTD